MLALTVIPQSSTNEGDFPTDGEISFLSLGDFIRRGKYILVPLHQEKERDVESLHIYFKKIKLKKANKPIVVSEYGGYALSLKDHIFNTENEYGYKKFTDIDSLNDNDVLLNLYGGF